MLNGSATLRNFQGVSITKMLMQLASGDGELIWTADEGGPFLASKSCLAIVVDKSG